MLLGNSRLIVLIMALAACARADEARAPEQAAAPPSEPAVVTVTTSEFAFTMPDTVTAGPIVFKLVNNGAELHHMQILRLDEGKTMADFAALPPNQPPPAWVVEVGGPNGAAAGGGQVETAVDLPAGNYVAVCLIPSPDGKPHIAKGMVRPFTVVAGSSAAAPLPTADLTMNLTDYAFGLSAPVTPGRHVIRVVNQAEQPHEVVLVRLNEGKNVQDVLAWVEKMEGPPPGQAAGGTTGMARSVENIMVVDFTPGDYVLLCFVPDHKDGRPHVAHGMVQQIKVGL